MKFPFRETKGQKRLVVANQKGGVGKTTLCLQIAFFLAEHDRNVLIVDMDGQQNITKALLDDELDAIDGSLTSYMLFQDDIDGLMPLEAYEGLSLIASTDDLHDVESIDLEKSITPKNIWNNFKILTITFSLILLQAWVVV